MEFKKNQNIKARFPCVSQWFTFCETFKLELYHCCWRTRDRLGRGNVINCGRKSALSTASDYDQTKMHSIIKSHVAAYFILLGLILELIGRIETYYRVYHTLRPLLFNHKHNVELPHHTVYFVALYRLYLAAHVRLCEERLDRSDLKENVAHRQTTERPTASCCGQN